MSKKNNFGDLEGKPPEQIPYEPHKPPDELKPVDQKENQKIKFSFADYLRFVWMYILKEGEGLLTPEKQAAEKVISWGTVIFIIISVIILILAGLWT